MTDRASIFTSLSLLSIELWEASLKRGEGSMSDPGELQSQGEVLARDVEDETAAFLIGVVTTLTDTAGQEVAVITTSFVAGYRIADGFKPTDDEISAFIDGGVLFQVHPYVREMVSSLAARAGLPAAFLPMLHREPED